MNERLQPAFWGGLFIGVLSALPLVSAGNCCCCLWVVSGGALATYLRQQTSPLKIDAAEGALVGLLAGVVGAIVYAAISIPLEMVVGPLQQQWMERLLASNPEVSARYRSSLEGVAASTAYWLVGILVKMVVIVVVGGLGGLLGVAI